MTAAEARTRIGRLLAGEPALDAATLDALVKDYQRADLDAAPDDPNDNAYDLHAAASEGWYHKAALVAGDYGVNLDGQTLNRQQAWEHCIQMATTHGHKALPRVMRIRRTDVIA